MLPFVSNQNTPVFDGTNNNSNVSPFDKTQLTKILIGALHDLGYDESAIQLQNESGGILIESNDVQKFFNTLKKGQFEKIDIHMISKLPLKFGPLELPDTSNLENTLQEIDTTDNDNFVDNDDSRWPTIVKHLEMQAKICESIDSNFSKTKHTTESYLQLVKWCLVVKILSLITKNFFLEIVYVKKDNLLAILFLRNVIRKIFQMWESLVKEINFLSGYQFEDIDHSKLWDSLSIIGFDDNDDTLTTDKLIIKLTSILTNPTLESLTDINMLRNQLLDDISKLINPDNLLPKNRLFELLKQSIKYQKSQDCFNLSDDETDISPNDIKKNMIDPELMENSSTISPPVYDLLQDYSKKSRSITFTKKHTLSQNVDEIWYLQFSPDGKYLASASADTLTDKKILIYDIENDFKIYKILAGNDQCVLYLSFSPDSRYLVSCPFNEMANIYDIHSEGEEIFISDLFGNGNINKNDQADDDENNLEENITPHHSAQIINPINSFLISNKKGSSTSLNNNAINSASSDQNLSQSGNSPRIWCCDWFHTEGKKGIFVVGSPDREVVFYDTNQNKIIFRMNGTTGVQNLKIDPVTGRKELFPRIHDIKITYDDENLILMTHQGSIDVYNLKQFPNYNVDYATYNNSLKNLSLQRIGVLPVMKKMTCISLPQIKNADDPLASKILISLQSNEIQLWDFKEQILIQKYFGQKQEQFIIRSCFGYNNKLIASGSEDGRIYIWYRDHGNILTVLPGHINESRTLSNSKEKNQETSRKKKKFEKNCNVVVWNPKDRTMFASGGDDGYIHIWEVERK